MPGSKARPRVARVLGPLWGACAGAPRPQHRRAPGSSTWSPEIPVHPPPGPSVSQSSRDLPPYPSPRASPDGPQGLWPGTCHIPPPPRLARSAAQELQSLATRPSPRGSVCGWRLKYLEPKRFQPLLSFSGILPRLFKLIQKIDGSALPLPICSLKWRSGVTQ